MTRVLARFADPVVSVSAFVWHALSTARHANDIWRARQRLAQLDDARLCDLGLTRHEAITEAGRPIWDIPATPRCR